MQPKGIGATHDLDTHLNFSCIFSEASEEERCCLSHTVRGRQEVLDTYLFVPDLKHKVLKDGELRQRRLSVSDSLIYFHT